MPFNDLSSAQAERLALLLEELGEAQQAIGKILRHGYDNHNPKTPDVTNRNRLNSELGDVLAAMKLMIREGDIDHVDIKAARREKLKRVGQYLHHQDDGYLHRQGDG